MYSHDSVDSRQISNLTIISTITSVDIVIAPYKESGLNFPQNKGKFFGQTLFLSLFLS
jgi:hypothetical protein